MSEPTGTLLAGRYVRVDRTGYSGSIHAAEDGQGGLWTACGRRVGPHWRVSVSAFDPQDVDCKLCRKVIGCA